jgi:hypothetical protein
MRSIDNHFFSVYRGNIRKPEPIRTTNLRQFIKDISDPDEETIKLVDKIRRTTDKNEKARLKTNLTAYSPCVLCTDGRSYKHIYEFSGLMTIDFDKLPSTQYAKDVRKFLIDEYASVYCSWLSASGLGVRAIIHIDTPTSTDDFKKIFQAFKHNYIEDYEIIDYFDNAPKNVVLPLFQSVDFDMTYRETAEQFTERYAPIKAPQISTPPIRKPDSYDERRVVSIITSAISKIIDNGHPQLRATAFVLGGYVGGGYIEQYQAIDLIDALINSNQYLSIKPDVYKITARQMIQQGISKPLYL